jgi:hypothetical protein
MCHGIAYDVSRVWALNVTKTAERPLSTNNCWRPTNMLDSAGMSESFHAGHEGQLFGPAAAPEYMPCCCVILIGVPSSSGLQALESEHSAEMEPSSGCTASELKLKV